MGLVSGPFFTQVWRGARQTEVKTRISNLNTVNLALTATGVPSLHASASQQLSFRRKGTCQSASCCDGQEKTRLPGNGGLSNAAMWFAPSPKLLQPAEMHHIYIYIYSRIKISFHSFLCIHEFVYIHVYIHVYIYTYTYDSIV